MPSRRPSPPPRDTRGAFLLAPETRRRRTPSSARVRPAVAAAAAGFMPKSGPDAPPPPPPSRKSKRRRRPRALPYAAVAQRAELSAGKMWSIEDEVALLTGAAAFRARTGAAPRLPDVPELFASLKDSLAPHIDEAKVYYKLKRLKSKFVHTAPAGGGPHELRVRELSADVWASEAEGEAATGARQMVVRASAEEMEQEAAADKDEERFPIMCSALKEYLKAAGGRGLSEVTLEKGVRLIGVKAGHAVEAKWRRQAAAETRVHAEWHGMAKEVCGMLMEAMKVIGP